MAKSIIAIILPEYDDKENVLTSYDWKQTNFFDDNSALKDYIKQLRSFIDFYEDEECEIIYDGKNIEAFLYVQELFPDYYPSAKRSIKSLLRPLENWRKNRKSTENDEYEINYVPTNDEMRTEIATRMEVDSTDDYLIAVYITNYKAKTWKLSKDGKIFSLESVPMSIKEVFEWLATHRHPKREYNWNSKHGELGKGAHKDNKGDVVSVLKGSRQEAEKIMHKAIGERPYTTLHCYDNQYGKYMEYKQESTDEDKRVYHSFHIDDEMRVPQRVKVKLSQIDH